MTMNQILGALANADERTLSIVGRVLTGGTVPGENSDPDVRTINATEAATRLGVSRPTIYRMMDEGQLQTLTLRGVRRIRLASVFALAGSNRSGRRVPVGC